MKKILINTLIFSSVVFAQGNYFDILAGGYNINYKVPTILAGDASDDVVFDYDTQTANYRWLELEHDVYMMPNIRFETTNMFSTGKASGSGTINGFTINANANSTLRLDNKDLIVYWEVPFMDFPSNISVDWGLGAKEFDGLLIVENVTEEVLASTAPYLYGCVRVTTDDEVGLGLEANMKYINDGSSLFYEYVVKVDYLIDIPLPFMELSLGLEAGIRSMLLDYTSTAGEYAYIKYDGSFFGLVGHFGI